MAHKTRTGFIAPAPADFPFAVIEHENGRDIEHHPKGIFIHGDHRAGVYMDYAGLDSASWATFKLPADADYLRDIADAISMMADRIEHLRNGGL